MLKRLVVVLPALVACLDNGTPSPQPGTPTTPITFTELDAGGEVAVATGGVQVVTIADPLAVGLTGATTAGYELVPHAGAWPNAEVGDYQLRALADGHGEFSIATARGIAAGPIDSAEVARVVVRPAAYRLDSDAFAIDPSRPAIEVALLDATNRRLVDGSLAIGGATQTAWNGATLPAIAGNYALQLTADSTPATSATITVGASIDHVAQVSEDGRTCYHAYAGSIEVATAMTNVVHPDPNATNCEIR